jgi:hypothetical protein
MRDSLSLSLGGERLLSFCVSRVREDALSQTEKRTHTHSWCAIDKNEIFDSDAIQLNVADRLVEQEFRMHVKELQAFCLVVFFICY